MANTINWGKIYCEMDDNSSWGNESNTDSIENDAVPACFVK